MKTNTIAPITKIPVVNLFFLAAWSIVSNINISTQWLSIISILIDGLCALTIIVFIVLLQRYIKRAMIVHIIFSLSLNTVVFPLFFSAIDLLEKEKTVYPSRTILMFAITIIASIIIRFATTKKNLLIARKYNQESGLLDTENGFWDINKQFFLHSPSEQKIKNSFGNQIKDFLLPLAPTVGNIIYLRLNTSTLNFFNFVLLLSIASMFAYISALHLVIAYDLLNIEKNFKKRILIKHK